MDVSRCQSDLFCPEELAEWAEWLSAGLHGRNRWRLVVVLSGMLFAIGRRTVTTWLRGAGVCTDYKAYYYFLGSVGRNTQRIADQLLWWIFRKADLDESAKGHVLFAIDDSPTKRYGPLVEGAGVHHNPTPGPAEQKYVYGHVWVTLALIARHPWWGAIGLPILSKLYVRRKNFKRVPKSWSFQTKLEQAADMVEWLALWMRFFGKSLWIVVDGAYAKRPFLKRAMATGAVVISRLRCDAALFDLPPKPKPHQRGRKRKYGKRRIRLAQRVKSRRGWKTILCDVYGREEAVTYKTFLATWVTTATRGSTPSNLGPILRTVRITRIAEGSGIRRTSALGKVIKAAGEVSQALTDQASHRRLVCAPWRCCFHSNADPSQKESPMKIETFLKMTLEPHVA